MEYYQEKEQTLNGAAYLAILKDKLKPTIHHKRRGLLSKTAFLHHGNACPSVTVTTVETIQNLKFGILLAVWEHSEPRTLTTGWNMPP